MHDGHSQEQCTSSVNVRVLKKKWKVIVFILNSFTHDCNLCQALCLIYYVRVKKWMLKIYSFSFWTAFHMMITMAELYTSIPWLTEICLVFFFFKEKEKKRLKMFVFIYLLWLFCCCSLLHLFTDFYLCNNVVITITMFLFLFLWVKCDASCHQLSLCTEMVSVACRQ